MDANIKVGTSVGVKSKGFLAFFIRAFTGVPYSHWFMVVIAQCDSLDGKVKKGDKCITEAVEEGIVYSPLNKYDDTSKYTLIKREPVFSYDENIINNEALKHFGNPYDVEDLVLEQPFFIETGLWVFGKPVDKWICVKFVLYLLFKSSGEKYFADWYESSNKLLTTTNLLKTIN